VQRDPKNKEDARRSLLTCAYFLFSGVRRLPPLGS